VEPVEAVAAAEEELVVEALVELQPVGEDAEAVEVVALDVAAP